MSTQSSNKAFAYFALGLLACFIIVRYGVLAEKSTPAIPRDQTLIVGTNVGYPPFVFADDRGETIGLDIDIAKRIAEHMGRKLEIKHMGFDALILALKGHKVDCIIGGISITKKRLSEIKMIPYHGDDKAEMALVFWEELPAGITDVDSLLNRNPDALIATQMGSTMEEYLENHVHSSRIRSFEDIAEIILDIRHAKSTAAVLDYDAATSLSARMPAVRSIGFDVAADELLGYGIGVANDNEDMAAGIQEAVAELRERGVLDALSEQWFSWKDA